MRNFKHAICVLMVLLLLILSISGCGDKQGYEEQFIKLLKGEEMLLGLQQDIDGNLIATISEQKEVLSPEATLYLRRSRDKGENWNTIFEKKVIATKGEKHLDATLEHYGNRGILTNYSYHFEDNGQTKGDFKYELIDLSRGTSKEYKQGVSLFPSLGIVNLLDETKGVAIDYYSGELVEFDLETSKHKVGRPTGAEYVNKAVFVNEIGYLLQIDDGIQGKKYDFRKGKALETPKAFQDMVDDIETKGLSDEVLFTVTVEAGVECFYLVYHGGLWKYDEKGKSRLDKENSSLCRRENQFENIVVDGEGNIFIGFWRKIEGTEKNISKDGSGNVETADTESFLVKLTE